MNYRLLRPMRLCLYVWGAFIPKGPYFVLIGEEEGLEVTPNLFHILAELSLTEKERVIWIDAICIDQDYLVKRRRGLCSDLPGEKKQADFGT